jgi:PPM family protein phosphatase
MPSRRERARPARRIVPSYDRATAPSTVVEELTVQVTVHVCTRRSRAHDVNQDRAVVGRDVVASAPEVRRSELPPPVVVAVLDGLGGHAAGEVASDLAAQMISQAELPIEAGEIEQLLRDADAALFAAAQGDRDRSGMGTTAALLALDDGGSATIANVGDSSVWRVGDGGLDLLSIPDRVRGGILQCLGGHEGSQIHPHIRHLEVEPGDRLLLASDGLTDVVSSAAIHHALRGDAGTAAEQLLASVTAAGPPDDVTIVVVDIES